MMDAPTGQLCARARFWASLRVDGELSELESALLDSHLVRCEACTTYATGVDATAALLRAQAPAAHAPIALRVRRAPTRFVAAAAAAVLVVLAAALGGLMSGEVEPGPSSTVALRNVAVVSTVETPDQLRRLRRTSLLNQRALPRELKREPY